MPHTLNVTTSVELYSLSLMKESNERERTTGVDFLSHFVSHNCPPITSLSNLYTHIHTHFMDSNSTFNSATRATFHSFKNKPNKQIVVQ